MSPRVRPRERPLWFCLYLPRLGLELFTRSLEDDGRTRPAVLVAQHRLCQLNGAAQAQGLRPGQSLATAQSICPDLALAWRQPEREAAALDQLADWAWRFTPQVSLAPPDALLLELAGSLRLFRGLDRLQRQILEGIRGLGYSGLPGMAPTPLAALALARAGLCPDPDALAAGLNFDPGHDGSLRRAWTEAVARAARPLLAGLPLSCLERPRSEQEQLADMGLHRVADLLRLPRQALGRRFGRPLLDHLDRLTGKRPDPRPSVTPPPSFTADLHFLEDVGRQQALLFPMRRLLSQLEDWLRLRQLTSRRLHWILRHPRHEDCPIEVRCAHPQRDLQRWLELSRLCLERSPGLPEVASLSLQVTDLESHAGQADTLFPLHGDQEATVHPATLLDLLGARLGFDACQGIRPADDHLPELAWRPAVAGERHATTRDDHGDLLPGPRPLWLLDPPQPLASHDGRPHWHGPLMLQRGPERLDLLPWHPAKLAGACQDPRQDPQEGPRDYWVARHAGGSHCWVFQNRANQRWFLHGLFA